jgi:hypothetical protein
MNLATSSLSDFTDSELFVPASAIAWGIARIGKLQSLRPRFFKLTRFSPDCPHRAFAV